MKKILIDPKIEALLKEHNQGVKLDLGCGANKNPGFLGIDYRALPGVDIVHNLEKFPFPLPNECASLAVASHVVEHLDPHGGKFIEFMNEVWRLLKPDGEFWIAAPYAGSPGYWQDPTHCNPCSEVTWEYFDPMGPMTGGAYYQIYRPLPWKIKLNTWHETGNLEAVLIKKRIDKANLVDPSYLAKIK
jgi:SAM-dependent methyltransferase